ncbi:MAG TPA: hypothetical protein VLH60_00520 [Sedimentisphaerales bacterium]|nr:hypothetical protein [Sedimentisphaerales bacterium]
MRIFLLIILGCILAATVVFGSLMWFDEGFNVLFRQRVGLVRQGVLQTGGGARPEISPDQWTLARQAARQFIPRFEELARERADDPDTLLGLAFIYRFFPTRPHTYIAALDRVLIADPRNVAATALKTEHDAAVGLARVRYDIVIMDRILASSRIAGTGRVRIGPEDEPFYSMVRPGDPFIDWRISSRAGPEGKAAYYIHDLAAARSAFLERLYARLPQLLEPIRAAAAIDPDNAFYDYLKAELCFEMGQMQMGLEFVRSALSKSKLENYVDVARREAMRIMKAERLPRICRDYISTAGIDAKEYVLTQICGAWLDMMADRLTAQDNIAAARDMADLAQQVRQQCAIVPLAPDQQER